MGMKHPPSQSNKSRISVGDLTNRVARALSGHKRHQGRPYGYQTKRHTGRSDISAHWSVSTRYAMWPLLHRSDVARGTGSDAVCCQESFHQALSFARLYRRQLLAPQPMRVCFRGQSAKAARLHLHFPHPLLLRRPVTPGGGL